MSELYLQTARHGERTVITDQYFTAPLKIAKPFDRGTHTEVMLMCASPGLLEGDHYRMHLDMGAETRTAITTQSYQKLFRTSTGSSAQEMEILLGDKAALAYFPMPTIPFLGSRFQGSTQIRMADTAKLLYCDVVQVGRSGERAAFESYDARVCVMRTDRPVFLDRTRLVTAEADVLGMGFFEGYACQCLLYLYGMDPPDLPQEGDMQCAWSGAREGHSLRILGNSGDEILRYVRESLVSAFFENA